MRANSADFRPRVLATVLGGQSPPAVAERYGVSALWVRRVRQRHRDGGETGPRRRGPRRQALAADADRQRATVAAHPDATPPELKPRRGLAVSLATLWRALARLGLTLQKSRPGRASKTART